MRLEGVIDETFPALPGTVGEARARVCEFAARAGVTGERLQAIRLAVSEALTNAVLHAYPDPPEASHPPGSVRLCASLTAAQLLIRISDEGQGLQAQARRPGLGLGLALIAELSDEFAISRRPGGGTELTMRFGLPPVS